VVVTLAVAVVQPPVPALTGVKSGVPSVSGFVRNCGREAEGAAGGGGHAPREEVAHEQLVGAAGVHADGRAAVAEPLVDEAPRVVAAAGIPLQRRHGVPVGGEADAGAVDVLEVVNLEVLAVAGVPRAAPGAVVAAQQVEARAPQAHAVHPVGAQVRQQLAAARLRVGQVEVVLVDAQPQQLLAGGALELALLAHAHPHEAG
jgi:hypothetical protein